MDVHVVDLMAGRFGIGPLPVAKIHIEVSLAAEKLFNIGPIPVTNSMLTMFIVMALILIVFSAIARRAQVVPGRGQGLLEMIAEFLLGLVEGTAGRRVGRQIFPLVSGLFVFILFANYTELLPGFGTIGQFHTEEGEKVLKPFLRPPTADLNMTLAMSILTFVIVQIAGIRAHGVGGRIKHMANPWWIFPLEAIQEVARIISLSFRLFGNIFAGDILLAVMYAIANAVKFAVVPVLFPVVFLGLELLFGTIQALVFALLTLIYISLATAGTHEDEDHEHEHAHEPAASGARTVPASAGD